MGRIQLGQVWAVEEKTLPCGEDGVDEKGGRDTKIYSVVPAKCDRTFEKDSGAGKAELVPTCLRILLSSWCAFMGGSDGRGIEPVKPTWARRGNQKS